MIAKYNLNWILKNSLFVLLYLALISPVLLSKELLFPFITTKTIFFRLIVEAALLVYVWLAIRVPDYRPKMNILSWLISAFGLIVLITGITGVDFYRSFWGTIERGEGFLTISHLIVFFLILSWTFKNKKEWFYYFTGIVSVSLFVNFYAILQKLNVENFFLYGHIISSGGDRLSATIGNAAFLGAYTLANFFLSLLLFTQKKYWGWKAFFGFSGLLNLYVLYSTQTRGAAIALIGTLILLCIAYLIKNPSQKKKKVATTILVLIILSGTLIWFNKKSSFVQNSPTLRRLTEISLNDITTESRLLAWQTSWQGWSDRFWLGYGWENYNIAFNKYFPAKIYKDAGSQLWFDRAHNTVFDIAVATGVFGLLTYLAIFFFAIFYLLKSNKNFEYKYILSALLIAHFTQNIFVFDVLASYIILFSVLASVSSLKNEEEEKDQQQNTEKKYINTTVETIVMCLALAILINITYTINLQPLKANKLGVQGLKLANMGKINQSIDKTLEGINLNTYQTTELRQKMADNALTYNRPAGDLSQRQVHDNYKKVITELQKNIEKHPQDVQNYLYLMTVYNRAGTYDPIYYQKVLELGKQAIELSPTRPQIYFEMGQASISQGKGDRAIEYFKKGVEQNPETLESHWSLMAAYILTGQSEKAEQEKEFLTENGYDFNSISKLQRILPIYIAAKNIDKVIETLEKMISIEPNANYYAQLASAYYQNKQNEKAIQAVDRAVELNPSLKQEAQKFKDFIQQNN